MVTAAPSGTPNALGALWILLNLRLRRRRGDSSPSIQTGETRGFSAGGAPAARRSHGRASSTKLTTTRGSTRASRRSCRPIIAAAVVLGLNRSEHYGDRIGLAEGSRWPAMWSLRAVQLLSIFIRGVLIARFGGFSILAPAPIPSTGSRARCVIVVVVYALWLWCARHMSLAAAHLHSSYSWLARDRGGCQSQGAKI